MCLTKGTSVSYLKKSNTLNVDEVTMGIYMFCEKVKDKLDIVALINSVAVYEGT